MTLLTIFSSIFAMYYIVFIASLLVFSKTLNPLNFILVGLYFCAALLFAGKITGGEIIIAVILFVIALLNFVSLFLNDIGMNTQDKISTALMMVAHTVVGVFLIKLL